MTNRGQIEPDEMGAIVKCLSDVKNIGEGRTEEMLLAAKTRFRV